MSNPLSLFDISGKSALVIGATGTFGSAGATALAQMGCDVTLADMDAGKLDALASDLDGHDGRIRTVCAIPPIQRRPLQRSSTPPSAPLVHSI